MRALFFLNNEELGEKRILGQAPRLHVESMEVMDDLIFLIGYRGVGKTSVGKRLANLLEYDFLDTDLVVTRKKKAAIRDIVDREGWKEFRRCERAVLDSTKTRRKTVVATGGGAVLHRLVWQELKKCSRIFWLTADEEVIIDRICSDTASSSQRPSLTGAGIAEELREVLKERIPLYEKIAHVQVDSGRFTIEETVAQIERLLTSARP